MNDILKILIPVLGAVISFIGGIIVWFLNERSKRIFEEYKRKEENYKRLLNSLKGFYINSFEPKLIDNFLNELNICWLYCSDEVLLAVYTFLERIHTEHKCDDKDKEEALGKMIVAIRKDLISRKPLKKTKMTYEDYKTLKVNLQK